MIVASPQSTCTASAGSYDNGTKMSWILQRSSATVRLTEASQPSKLYSATRHSYILWAVWRCLRGAFLSDSRHLMIKVLTSSVMISFFLPLPGFRSHGTVCPSQYFFTVLRDMPSILLHYADWSQYAPDNIWSFHRFPLLLPLLVPPVHKLFLLLYRIFIFSGSLFYYHFEANWLSFILAYILYSIIMFYSWEKCCLV